MTKQEHVSDEERAKVARDIVAKRDPNPRLTRMYHEWQQAEQRKQMAQETFNGATGDALVKEAKFKGAVDFVGGPGATWRFEPDLERVVVTEGHGPEPDRAPPKPNGRGFVLDGKMSAKQMQVVASAQRPHHRKRR